MSNDNRPKKSWREIDRARESGGSSSRGGSAPRRDGSEERQQKQYRAALEALFNGGGLGTLADKLAPLPLRPQPGSPNTVTPPTDPPLADAEIKPREVVGAAAAAAPAPAEASGPPQKGKKKPDDRLTLRRKVVEAAGRHEISRAVEKYLEKNPLPEDHEFLEQLLEHEKEARVAEGMVRIAALLDQGHAPKRSRALCGKLRYLQDTSSNADLREQAQALLQRLL